ncbi:MAG: DUF2807 domain-containing protein, partial [Hyphomonadaceae bacterium]
ANELQIRDAAAIVRIDAENRRDVAISIENNGPLPNPRVRVSGRKLIIDGAAGRIRDCEDDSVSVGRHGEVPNARLPHIRVRMPMDAKIALGGAVTARIGPMDAAHIVVSGCGNVLFGDVATYLHLAVSGVGDVRGGRAGTAELSVAGASDVVIGDVEDGLTVSLAGAGDVSTGRLQGGDVRIVVQGAGDVTIGGGRAEDVTVVVTGAGSVDFPGRAQSLDAFVAGVGEVNVGAVSGQVNRRVLGLGEINIGH